MGEVAVLNLIKLCLCFYTWFKGKS
uniref:Uncharacterized protein n=1 Tax=Tetranychus urticae TaxID=32264 RepID=T1KLH0_TETUR